MFHLTEIRNVRLGNALDGDMKITWSQNVPSHQKITRNGNGKYVLMNISSLQTDYLSLESSSGSSGNSERAHSVKTKCKFCGVNNHAAEKCFKKVIKEREKTRVVDVSSNRNTERLPRKWFRCESEDHMIAKCPKQVCFNEKGNRACDNDKNNSDCNIYASMARMSSNDKWKIVVRLITETEHLCKRGDRIQG